MAKRKVKGRKRAYVKRVAISMFFLIVITSCFMIYDVYQKIYQPNVALGEKKITYLYIPTYSTLDDVTNLLYENNFIINRNSFQWLAEQKNYSKNVYPGRYKIKSGMNNNDLINLLRSGKQEPLNVSFNNVRTKEELVGKLTKNLEADSIHLIKLINDQQYTSQFGMNTTTIITLFLPNTYQFNWNTSAEQIMERMADEYKKFWNDERKQKAKNLGMSQTEVAILASIVQKETNMNDEKPLVAGVYINRLKKGMMLQADPTVIHAIGDFSIRRVLKKHREVDSPYNTYRYKGLPPSPICLPSISSINAVLNYTKSDYLFFCAKEDFSGYHNFARTNREHNNNAKRYQSELNKRKIYK